MTLEQAKPLRDLITKLFERGAFDEGMTQIKANNSNLPPVVVLECEGNFCFYKRDLQGAVKKYEAAIRINPEYLIARYQYLVGTQEEKKNDLVSAFKRYQSAIEIEPTFVDSYVELGGLLVKVGDLTGAAQCYRDALRLVPTELANVHNLKEVLVKLAAKEPDQYAEELAAVEVVYKEMELGGTRLPAASQW